MVCYSPYHCFVGGVKENGRKEILWKAPHGTERQEIPCGKCVGCKLKYSSDWAKRCWVESQCWNDNSFVTLTYDDEHLAENRSLDKKVWPSFIRDLRRKFCTNEDGKVVRTVRYYMCGEYGLERGRPHYHGILFNMAFPDKQLYSVRNGNRLYTSEMLQSLWPYGFSSVGEVTMQSASYVARYVLKKQPTKEAVEEYCDKRTGEVLEREFTLMSRKPGIGALWFEKFKSDIYPSDQFVHNGVVNKPPRFFDKLLEKFDPQMLDQVKQVRADFAPEWNEATDLRLRVKEQVKLAQIKTLQKTLS